jgi:hypothetical protein
MFSKGMSKKFGVRVIYRKIRYLLHTYLSGYLFQCTERKSDIIQMCVSCQCISFVYCETNDTKISQIAFRNHFDHLPGSLGPLISEGYFEDIR